MALQSQGKGLPARHVVAVFVGNGLEFYDFLSYALFATYIAKAFFPGGPAGTGLLVALATFGAGFITRPIGAIVLGSMGDRIGRKPAMLISFLLIGGGMLGLALTPTYAQIGVAAPILVLCFRLIQGFALGGEVGPTTAYMLEAAPASRRGFYGSLQYTSQDLATLIAAIVGMVLSMTLAPADLQAWGWRIAFLLGVAIVPFGILIRRGLPETLHAADDAALAPDGARDARRPRLGPHLKTVVLGLILLSSTTIGAYVINYMATYATNTLHSKAGVSFGVIVVTSLVAVCFEPISGLLSDRFGRRPVMIIPYALTLLAVLPGFWLMSHAPSTLTLYGCMGVISLLMSLATPPVIIALTETLPRRVRSGAVATVYAFAISVFGGSTQFIITWLIRATGDPMAPGWYWTGAIIIGLTAMFLMTESAPAKVGGRGAAAGADRASMPGVA